MRSARPFRSLTVAAAAAVLLAGCATAGDDPQAEPADASAVTLEVADSPLGPHLVDGDGLTLYLFDEDEPSMSTCTGPCLENWPALTVDGEPVLGDGIDQALVGTIEREDDGSTQVTYAGMPLYRWVGDRAAGDVEGQGVNDVWWVVAPNGAAITAALDDVGMDDGGGSYSY